MDVKHIAQLARLDLTSQETKVYSKQFEEILGYVEKLKELDVQNVATADGGAHNLENIWREDFSDKVFSNKEKELINMSPESENGQIKVKSVFNNND